jgi:hypothetical protein
MYAGTVNWPAEVGAAQMNEMPALLKADELPATIVRPFGSPPLHVTVTPANMSIPTSEASLVQVGGEGTVTAKLNGPTLTPPIPDTSPEPGWSEQFVSHTTVDRML